jgi:hypothetical protein
MIPYLQQLSTTTCDLRKFRLGVGGVFLLLGGWFLFRHKAAGPYLVMGNYMLDKRDQPKFTETADWKTEFRLG